MTPFEFIESIKSEVRDAAVSDVMMQLASPSGRRPPESIRRLSSWYAELSDEDREKLRGVARLVSHHAVFGFLAVLDGARAVEDSDEKGVFRLIFDKSGSETLLTSESLHEIFNAERAG